MNDVSERVGRRCFVVEGSLLGGRLVPLPDSSIDPLNCKPAAVLLPRGPPAVWGTAPSGPGAPCCSPCPPLLPAGQGSPGPLQAALPFSGPDSAAGNPLPSPTDPASQASKTSHNKLTREGRGAGGGSSKCILARKPEPDSLPNHLKERHGEAPACRLRSLLQWGPPASDKGLCCGGRGGAVGTGLLERTVPTEQG